MRFTKKIPYQLKTLIPALGIAGASLFVACKPHNEPDISDKPTTTDTIPETPAKRNVELSFKRGNVSKLREDTINYYLAQENVDTIFVVPENPGGFQELTWDRIQTYTDILQRITNIDSTRIWGRGNFEFAPGAVLQEDSLWFVSRGWTVNKHLQNQR